MASKKNEASKKVPTLQKKPRSQKKADASKRNLSVGDGPSLTGSYLEEKLGFVFCYIAKVSKASHDDVV